VLTVVVFAIGRGGGEESEQDTEEGEEEVPAHRSLRPSCRPARANVDIDADGDDDDGTRSIVFSHQCNSQCL
jgi:hypothetical protein